MSFVFWQKKANVSRHKVRKKTPIPLTTDIFRKLLQCSDTVIPNRVYVRKKGEEKTKIMEMLYVGLVFSNAVTNIIFIIIVIIGICYGYHV